MTGQAPLHDEMVVVDLAGEITGGYCSKMLADGGARVIKVEPPTGDSLRRRSVSGAPVDPDRGGLLFGYLAASTESFVADPDRGEDIEALLGLIAGADVLIWSYSSTTCRHPELDPVRLREKFPSLLILAITPYGLDSPWADKPSTQFTLEAMAGGAWARGGQTYPPVMCGGDLRAFTVGAVGALSIMLAWQGRAQSGSGELIDLSELEAMQYVFSFYSVTFNDAAGRPWRPDRLRNIPDIHKTVDGYVSIWVTTGQQWLDFCVMVGREDWADDKSLGSMDVRARRGTEMRAYIDEWCSERTTEEVVEFATALRVPAAEVGNGRTLSQADHLLERGMVTTSPATGLKQPGLPYAFHGTASSRTPTAAPRLGEQTASLRAKPPEPRVQADTVGDAQRLACEGLRIIDLTAFMAGPIITHFPAFFGAEVIHVESHNRPDGFRAAAVRPLSEAGWWESSPFFAAVNTNKRDLAVDLSTERGREVLRKLVAESDVLVENFSPRVMGQLGLDYETLREINPGLLMLRAPGFGLSGPWRDRPAYAPTVDAAGGGAWVTGFPDAPPNVNNATFDALGGIHASFAMLLALQHRRRTGEGMLVECPQVAAALMTSGAEQIMEWDANGALLERVGNRSWVVAPQGVYPVADVEQDAGIPSDDWVAVSIESDDQWQALAGLLPGGLADAPELQTVSGRLAEQDRLDTVIADWTRDQTCEDVVAQLHAVGVPAARVVHPRAIGDIEPVRARGFWEAVHQGPLGEIRIPAFPAQFASASKPAHRTAAPALGADNHRILKDILGYDDGQVAELEAQDVIGEETAVMTGW